MPRLPLILFATLGVVAAPLAARATGTPASVRNYIVEYSVRRLGRVTAHALIPAWARKYNMNCSGCHYPAVPRLNATGIKFRWAGYRMPEEIGEAQAVSNVANFVAIRGRVRYEYEKEEGGPVSTSAFEMEDATLFFAGSFGKSYGGFFEIEREAADEVGLGTQFTGVWGVEKAFGGLRAGLGHWLGDAGIAGLDRPTGIRRATPIGGPTTAGLPFRLSGDQLGLEAFYVAGRNRLAFQLLNGVDPTGSGEAGDTDTKKDFLLTEQFLLDEQGSGATALAYYGTIVGADTSAPGVSSHFWRLGVSANKILSSFELLGGFVYSKDQDVPVGGGSLFTASEYTGNAYWFSGQYLVPKKGLTFFGRYEFLDPDTDTSDDANRRVLLGSVLSLNLPEYLRLALEYALDNPQAAGAPKQHSLIAELQLAF